MNEEDKAKILLTLKETDIDGYEFSTFYGYDEVSKAIDLAYQKGLEVGHQEERKHLQDFLGEKNDKNN